MTPKQAEKLMTFRKTDEGTYEVNEGCGWMPCTPKQAEWLTARRKEHVPLAPIYQKAGEYSRAQGCNAFRMFVIPGIRRQVA